MAVTATDVDILRRYAEGVMNRADHHAGEVTAAALALLGGIIWRAEPGSIEIKQYGGNLANVLWFKVSGQRFAFAYNHQTEVIELRTRTQSGPAIRSFDNQSTVEEIEDAFRSL